MIPARRRNSDEYRVGLRRWATSYLGDWLLTLFLWFLAFVLSHQVPGYKREFSLNDTSIQHTFAEHERVPTWALRVISILIPVVVMPFINVLNGFSLWDLHNSYLGLALGHTFTECITFLIKITVGRPRPDLIARCLPREGATDHPLWGLTNYTVCTQTDTGMLENGFRSFPSGHSSSSFAGLGFLTFYLAGKLGLWDGRGHTLKAWAALAPLLGATMVAVSRTMDNRHHWQDVVVGSLLGVMFSYFSYRQYYPSLFHSRCHMPLPPRENVRQRIELEEGTNEEREALRLNEQDEEARLGTS